jgi:DNA repair exonuclease SbcCD nuclease subunit
MADAHLDTPFYGREEEMRRKLREATRQAFGAVAGEAINRHVDGLLIAGDLFDNELLSFTTERFLLEQMWRLREARIPVYYATGNHDPGRTNYRARHLGWPDNVHLFTGTTPRTVPVGETGWLTAAGHSTAREETDLASRFGPVRGDRPHVALLHTQVMSARGADLHDRYAPCSRSDLEELPFDYWALGHIHVRQRVFDDLPAWYAGNLQGRNPRETGPKGALYVEIEKGIPPEPEFLPLAPVVWDSIHLDCPETPRTLDELTRSLGSLLKERLDLEEGREHLVRVDLGGQSHLARELSIEGNLEELSELLRVELSVDWLELRPRDIVRPVPLEEYRGSATVLGKALELIERARADDELLKRLGPEELASRPGDRVEYLRSLLERGGRDLASVLVPGGER